jgi:hypothetical protein
MEWSTLDANVDRLERVQTLSGRGGLLGSLCGLLLLLLLWSHAHLRELLCHAGDSSGSGTVGIWRLVSSSGSAVCCSGLLLLRVGVAGGLLDRGTVAIASSGLGGTVGGGRRNSLCRGLAGIGASAELKGLTGIGSLLLCWELGGRPGGARLRLVVLFLRIALRRVSLGVGHDGDRCGRLRDAAAG